MKLKDTIKNMVKCPWPGKIHSASESLHQPPARVQPYKTALPTHSRSVYSKSTPCQLLALLRSAS